MFFDVYGSKVKQLPIFTHAVNVILVSDVVALESETF